MILLDTSGLLCCYHRDETEHTLATALFKKPGRKLTHSYVLAEFTMLTNARHLPRLPAITFLRDLMSHTEVEIVWVDAIVHEEALTLLENRLDKDYSFCDAVSFVLMRRLGIHEALTTDHHFEQEGFRKLLG